MNQQLSSLANKYRNRISFNIKGVASITEKFRLSKHESFIDTLVVAISLNVNIIRNQGNKLALEALEKTNPNFNPDNLDIYSDEQLLGIINSSKGKYFELLVVDRLNNGEQVGDLLLPSNYKAQLADSLTQPGWDLRILDEENNPIEYLQLKSTDSVSYISETLQKYPDIKILATDEVSGIDDLVISSGITNEEITSEMVDEIISTNDSFLENFIENFNPIIPISYILASQGLKLVMSKNTYKDVIENGKHRIKKSLLTSTVGAGIYSIGGGWLAIPFTFGISAVYNENKIFSDLSTNFHKITEELYKFNIYRHNKKYGFSK